MQLRQLSMLPPSKVSMVRSTRFSSQVVFLVCMNG